MWNCYKSKISNENWEAQSTLFWNFGIVIVEITHKIRTSFKTLASKKAANCKFIVKNSSLKMLVVFSPIFVADTKTTFVYNFVAPLRVLWTMFKLRDHLQISLLISSNFIRINNLSKSSENGSENLIISGGIKIN